MRLDAFILADAVATPPDGKFYIQGGGLTRAEAPKLPAEIRLGALIQLGVDEEELKADHHISLTLLGPTGNPNVDPIEIDTKFDPEAAGAASPGEELFAVLAVPLHGVAIRAGVYRVELQVDDEIRAARTFVFKVPEGVAPVADLVAVASPVVAAKQRPAKQNRPPAPPKKRKAKRR